MKKIIVSVLLLTNIYGASAQSLETGIKMVQYERYENAKKELSSINSALANFYTGLALIGQDKVDDAKNIFNKYPKFSNADDNSKSIDDLREEAYRIIEIIDAQKDTLNLPTLGETIKEIKKPINEDNLATKKEAKNISEKEGIKNTLDDILINFKKKVSNLLEKGVKSVYLVKDFKVISSLRIQKFYETISRFTSSYFRQGSKKRRSNRYWDNFSFWIPNAL